MPPDSRDVLVLAQFREGTNLGACQELYHRFGTARRPWQAWVFDHLRLPDRARVLEVGCGRGSLWVENQDRIPPGWRVTLSDFSPGMVAEARAGLRALPDFHFVVAELSQLPFPEGSFDAVIANQMLFHVPNLELGLAEIHRVLGRGGVLIAATNGPEHLLELRQLQARIGTQAGARTHVDTAFDLATGPPFLNPPLWPSHREPAPGGAPDYRPRDSCRLPALSAGPAPQLPVRRGGQRVGGQGD